MTRCLRALPVLIALLVTIGASASASAAGGAVSIVPAYAEVGTFGGTVDIDVVIDPPDGTLSIWIIQIAYDPNVVQVIDCEPMPDPGGPIAFASGCATKDTNMDFVHDTAVAFGGWVQNQGGIPVGFDTTQTAATFTFQSVGLVGEHSDLDFVGMQNFLGPNGENPSMSLNGGVIYIVAATPSPPPTPTQLPTPVGVGGTVELVSAATASDHRWQPAIVLSTLVAITATAFAFSRRMMRR